MRTKRTRENSERGDEMARDEEGKREAVWSAWGRRCRTGGLELGKAGHLPSRGTHLRTPLFLDPSSRWPLSPSLSCCDQRKEATREDLPDRPHSPAWDRNHFFFPLGGDRDPTRVVRFSTPPELTRRPTPKRSHDDDTVARYGCSCRDRRGRCREDSVEQAAAVVWCGDRARE